MGSGAVDSSCSGAVNLATTTRVGAPIVISGAVVCGVVVVRSRRHFARAACIAVHHHFFGIVDGSGAARKRGQFSRTVNRRVALDERLSPYLRTLVGCAPHGAAVSRGSSSSSSSSSLHRGTGWRGRVSGDMCCASGVSETRTISGSHHGSRLSSSFTSLTRSLAHSLTHSLARSAPLFGLAISQPTAAWGWEAAISLRKLFHRRTSVVSD